jgi:hypothetical protein
MLSPMRGLIDDRSWSPAGRGAIEAAGSWASQALVQEIVDCRTVLRVHATDDQVLGAFARPAATIAGRSRSTSPTHVISPSVVFLPFSSVVVLGMSSGVFRGK